MAATHLVYTTAPDKAYDGLAMLQQPVVEAQDGGNVTDATYVTNVTLTLVTTSGTASLTGTTTKACVSGKATFTDVGILASADWVGTIHAASGTLTAADSATMKVYAFDNDGHVYGDTPEVDAPATISGGTARPSDASFTTVVHCTTQADVNAAIASLVDNTRIAIAAGATIKAPAGGWVPPNRAVASGWVEFTTDISTAALNAVCPEGTRMTPTMAAALNLAKLQPGGGSPNVTFATPLSANGYRFTALEFAPDPAETTLVSACLRLGNLSGTTAAQVGQRFGVDRCYLHGSQTRDTVRGVALQGANSFVIDSWLSDFYYENRSGAGAGDSQGINIAGSKGPYLIQNNHLEGWSENILIGGVNSAVLNLDGCPSDITIRRNYVTKNAAMRTSNTQSKNNLEFKSGIRVLVEENIFENSFPQAQSGQAILVSNDSTNALPWGGTSNVEIRKNWIRHMGGGCTYAPSSQNQTYSYHAHAVWYHDNLFEDIATSAAVSVGQPDARLLIFGVGGRARGFWFENNTFVRATWQNATDVDMSGPAQGWCSFKNNVFQRLQYGFKAAGTGAGTVTLDAVLTKGYSFLANVLVGGTGGNTYPATTISTTDDASTFVDMTLDANGLVTNPAVSGSLATAGVATSLYASGGPVGVHDIAGLKTTLATVLAQDGTGDATATQLLLSTQPAGAVSGVALTTQPSGTVANDVGDTVTSDSSTITAAWVPVSGDAEASGTLSTVASAGDWAFTDLALTWTVASTGYWRFTDGALTSVNSNTLTLTVAEPPPPPPPDDDFGIPTGAPAVYRMARGKALFAGFRRMVRALWRWLTLSTSLA